MEKTQLFWEVRSNMKPNMKKDTIIITIGREFGSGGLEVAKELGKRLNIPVYDKELIAAASKDSGLRKDFFEKSDEKKSLFSLSSLFNHDNIMSDSSFFNIQCETIRKIASNGSAIIVGRCSDYVLRDYKNVFNVFLTCEMDCRIERVMRRNHLTHEEAEIMIEKKDKSRREYYNYYTFGNWGAASTYHICLDTAKFGIDGTANTIISAMKNEK